MMKKLQTPEEKTTITYNKKIKIINSGMIRMMIALFHF